MIASDTRRWLERAVIGLNLCPFAKAVHVKGLLHIAVSRAPDAAALLEEVEAEFAALVSTRARERETTLLVVPHLLADFFEFNEFTQRCERLIRRRKLEGVIQLATFHPQYQFAGSEPDDVGNFTNRSPYPILHFLREESMDRAVEAFPQAEAIYETNMETMRKLGRDGWDRLMAERP